MTRTLAAWLLPVALLTGSAAVARRGPEPIELSEEDDGHLYRVPIGTEFEVRLFGEVGEHDQWEMRDDPRFITVDPPLTQSYGNKRGDREDRVFKVRVTQPGRFPLVYEKLSTFGDKKRSLARRVTYMIEAGTPGSRGRDDPAERNGQRGPAAPTGAALSPLREADAGRVIHVPEGREIVILLPFASRLDQRWDVIASSNIGFSAAITEQRDPDWKRNIFWLDSNSVVRLLPGGRGKAEVTLAYLPRPHDGGPTRQLRYRFLVD